MKRGKYSIEGQCGNCGSSNINYEGSYPEDDMIYYPYTCEDCGKSGREWYRVEYAFTDVYKE